MSTTWAVPVLMYHHVSPARGSITTSPENFESQVSWLARHGYRSLGSAELADYINGRPMPARTLVMTFDDGYLDNWVYAHPILAKYGFKALMFVVTGWIHDGPARPHAGQGPVPDTPDHKECKRLIEAGRNDQVIVRWAEVNAMQQAGTFEFHSHTHTHTRWDQVVGSVDEKRERIAAELADSRQALQRHAGVVSEHLCWPQGYFDDDYQEEARAAGFRYFYTTDAYGQNVPGMDPEHIYRFSVKNRPGRTLGRRTRVAAHPAIGPLYNRFKRWEHSRRANRS